MSGTKLTRIVTYKSKTEHEKRSIYVEEYIVGNVYIWGLGCAFMEINYIKK
jgi:hypothetical protein